MTIIAVFGSSAVIEGDAAYIAAYEAGSRLAAAGLAVATGGYGGVMEAASRGASEAGGHVVGVTAPSVFPQRTGPNRWVDEEIPTTSITERIHVLVSSIDGALVLDGSIGTAAELLLAWNVNHVTQGHRPALPTVLVGETWATLIDSLVTNHGADSSQIIVVDDVEVAVAALVSALGNIDEQH